MLFLCSLAVTMRNRKRRPCKSPSNKFGRNDKNFLVDPLLKSQEYKTQKEERSPSATSLVKRVGGGVVHTGTESERIGV